MNIMNLITLSAWVGFWMAYSRKCRRSNERCSCSGYIISWQIHLWKSDWHAQQRRLRHSPTGIETDNAYMSHSAAIRRSRDFSSVGCHIGMSKYLTRKGHTTLSKTWNRKNLPKTNNQYNRQMQIIYIMHSPKHRSSRFGKELSVKFHYFRHIFCTFWTVL